MDPIDFIHNGQASGGVAALLLQNNFDVGSLRPYIDVVNGRPVSCVTSIRNGKPTRQIVSNATATLRKDQWIHLDTQVVKVARERLRVVSDLVAAGLTYNIPNGLGKTVLQTETEGDINDATISMDGINRSINDRPLYELTSLPLPIVHKDFYFSARQIATAANSGSPLDTTMAEASARKVAETIEKLHLGTYGTYKFGGGNIYGFVNFPSRLTKTLTAPTATTWTATTTVSDILDMREKLATAKHYGPYMLYTSLAWDKYLDEDYSTAKGDNTLRDRIKKIDGITDVRTVDFLSTSGAFVMVLVQMTSDVVRVVNAMGITTVQWETQGGMQINYKVMGIMVPQLRADQEGLTGICHGAV